MSLVKSMTGYGRAVETVNGREFTVELRSVNNRYLDCTVKLPRSLSFARGRGEAGCEERPSPGARWTCSCPSAPRVPPT